MIKNKFNTKKILSFIALLWIASGHFFPIRLSIGEKIVSINAFSEFYLIPIFGIWRIRNEKDPFQKKRLKWMLILFGIYWLILPVLLRKIPVIDGTSTTLTTAYHTIGSIAFFLFFIAVILFGKRADCGWNCTCVFTRETVGFAFRDKTKKGDFWWKLRHLKWILLLLVWAFLIYLILDPEAANATFKRPLYKLILDIYYGTLLLVPLIGHRNICRYACPWSATWAVLNKIGPYKIMADTSKCFNCGICERECDMGIPIQSLIYKENMIDTGECMGCERCVRKCPKDVLTIVDFRDKIPGFNMSYKQRGIRVILGLTFALLPFVLNNTISLYIGLVALYLFLSGLFGYSLFSKIFKNKMHNKKQSI
ncbi:4Fe-4S binding protein [Selenihalanaerobacter shriftii]|uniref:4Fe-4S binding domain-containing protein n=1 Tax=Selenihalanaerobacter shriftii TaxID=142842 RepID=A0A1T4NYY4_9FIRM|nr:4Fe-4S dicluster domain-containing protein [Selenihalanaerobacter shriftii]SJZ84297.1 4Fe-4S binding domain-containing protein [Selenihalanaerobacter shriftii]